MGCGDPAPRSSASKPPAYTVRLQFHHLVPASTVESLFVARPALRLRRVRFQTASVGGSAGPWEGAGLTSPAAKLDTFRSRLLTRTPPRTRVPPRQRRVRERLDGVSLPEFAGSVELQRYGLSLVRREHERDRLRALVERDGPLIHAVTATGPLSALRSLLDEAVVAGIVPERGRADWLVLALRNPFAVAFGRPDTIDAQVARSEEPLAWDRADLRAVSASSPDEVPDDLAALYDATRAAARTEFGVNLRE